MTSSVESLNLEMAVNTKSSQLTCPSLRRIQLLPLSLLPKHQVQTLNLPQQPHESIRKTGFPMTLIEAGRVLRHFRRIFVHALAHQLARRLPPAHHYHLRKHRAYFSTNAPIDWSHGQAIIGFPPLVRYQCIQGSKGHSSKARWSTR
jgi:hypothetical protein